MPEPVKNDEVNEGMNGESFLQILTYPQNP